MAITMRDVARQAGVSIKTVSRVVNGQGEISDVTRQRVLDIISETGFQPNTLARGLVSGSTLSVGLIVSDISDPFYAELARGVENVAKQHSYSVFLCNTDGNPQNEVDYINALAAKQVDGMMLCSTRLSDEQLTAIIPRHKLVVMTPRQLSGCTTVTIDGASGLYRITNHLIALGHRVIGHVGARPHQRFGREMGYRRALLEHGISPDERWVAQLPEAGLEQGRLAARRLLERSPELTALTCFNDVVAVGALRACADLGRSVPQDVAVVGFDDIPLAMMVNPALTTLNIPRYRLGQTMMELLLKVIAAGGHYEERIIVEPELVIRESCGAQLAQAHFARRADSLADPIF
jgi:DNA-binding LacI/PurR family transcriptional regulator